MIGRTPNAALRAAALTAVCAAGAFAGAQELPAKSDLVALGRHLFTLEEFGGNGRVCSTYHELERFGTITPEYVQALWRADPSAALFRPIDSDDGRDISYERLKQHATVRVPIELPTRTVSGLGVRLCDSPATKTIYVHRGNPTVFNVALERHLMHDGRDRDDLERQAWNAVHTHAEPAREPTDEELHALATFQASLFSHGAIARIASPAAAPEEGTGLPLELPEAHSGRDPRPRVLRAGPPVRPLPLGPDVESHEPLSSERRWDRDRVVVRRRGAG